MKPFDYHRLASPNAADGAVQMRPPAFQPLRGSAGSPGDVSGFMPYLLCLWVFSQFFYYQALSGRLTINVGIALTPDRILFFALLLLFAKNVLSGRTQLLRPTLVEFCMLAFAATCAVSYSLARPDAGYATSRFLTTIVNFAITPFAAFYIAKCSIKDRKTLLTIVKFLCLAGGYLVVTAIFEQKLTALVWPRYILDDGIRLHFGRARGPFVNSVVMGQMLTITFLACSVFRPFASRGQRFLLTVLLIATPAAVYFTFTRACWLAFGVALFASLAFRTKMRKPSVWIALLLAATVLSGLAKGLTFAETNLFARRTGTWEYRLENYKFALGIFAANPITGVGYGVLARELGPSWARSTGAVVSEDRGLTLADGNHNTFLGLLAELGLLGMLPYLLLHGSLLRLSLRSYRQFKEPDEAIEKLFSLATLVALLTYLLIGQFSDLRFRSVLNTVVFLQAGLLSGLGFRSTVRSASQRVRTTRWRGLASETLVPTGTVPGWRFLEKGELGGRARKRIDAADSS